MAKRRELERDPFVHRTPGKKRIAYQRTEPGSDEPPRWLRSLLSRHLARIEERIGTRIVRSDAPRMIYKPLGCGMFGCVFGLEDGRVLKITSEEIEGPLSERIRRLQTHGDKAQRWPVLASTARIDAVYRFPERARCDITEDWQEIYLIVRERVGDAGEDIPEDLARALDEHTAGWETYSFAEEDDEEAGRLLGSMMARVTLPSIYRAGGVDGKRIAALLRLLWRQGGPLMDVHRYNFARRLMDGSGGAKVGQIVCFDFGSHQSFSMIPPDVHRQFEFAVFFDAQGVYDYAAIEKEIRTL